MKTTALLYLLIAALPLQPSRADETNLTLTVSGVTYSNVVFVRSTPYAVSVRHSTGIAAIPLSQLPPDLQQRFGYNPTNSAQYRKAELGEAERIRQADAAARTRREASERQAALDTAAKAPPVPDRPTILVKLKVYHAHRDGALVGEFTTLHHFPDGSEYWNEDTGQRDENFILGLTGVYDGNLWTGKIAQYGNYTFTTTAGDTKTVPQYILR